MEPPLVGGRVVDLLREGCKYLTSREVEDPYLTSELLLCHVLGLGRVGLFLVRPSRVGASDRVRFRQHLLRRASGEPLQYITGEIGWLDLSLLVRRGVFIPRQETETLVEATVNRLRERGEGDAPLAVFDIGTGAGNIAIAMARHLPNATVYASDISTLALLLARENSRRNGVAHRVHLVQGDLLDAFRTGRRADLVISNPPYVRTSELPGLQIEVRGYEPKSSLDGGPDGLRAIRRLVEDSPRILKEGGILALEVGIDHSEELTKTTDSCSRFRHLRIVGDLSGAHRVFLMEF